MKEKKQPRAKAQRPRRHHVNVMVVPHGGGRSRTIYVHGLVLVFLVSGGLAILTFAGVMVSGYWKNIINLSQLAVYESRDRDETRKLEIMERGVGDLNGFSEKVNGQYEALVTGHRLTEVRPAEALLPAGEVERGRTLEAAESRVARVGRGLTAVRKRFEADPDALAVIPSIVPCAGWFYRDFGNTVSPFTGRLEMHRGLDIVAQRGTPIVATAAGTVTASGLEEHYGLTVTVDHGNGYVTRYSHNMRNVAQVGTRVKRGQVIAYVGSTGRSTCTHVHYEVIKDGVPLNPRYFILREPPARVTVAAAPPRKKGA